MVNAPFGTTPLGVTISPVIVNMDVTQLITKEKEDRDNPYPLILVLRF